MAAYRATRVLGITAILGLLAIYGAWAGPAATNVSAQVHVTMSGFLANRAPMRIWTAKLTVTNTSTTAIAAPIQVALTNLSTNAVMMNKSGMTGGDPFITVLSAGSDPLAPGASVKVSIQFTNSTNGFINFTPVTYSGGL